MSIFNYEVEFMENPSWTSTDNWVRPLYDATALDESLDFGQIVLFGTPRKEPYKPFTPIRISIYEVDNMDIDVCKIPEISKEHLRVDRIYRLVSDSKVEQKSFAYKDGIDLYVHSIGTIEYTKLLEREICDSLTFTKYLARDYLSGAGLILPTVNISGSGSVSEEDINSMREQISFNDIPVLSPQLLYDENHNFQEVTFNSFNNLIITNNPAVSFRSDSYKFIIKNPNGNISQKSVDNLNETFKTVLDKTGEYIVTYKFSALNKHMFNEGIFTFTIEYKILVIEGNIEKKPELTIKDVLERILSVCPTRRAEIDAQKYFLDNSFANKYADIDAPEFHITRSTLWEALSQIGGYIHAIPRLNYPNIITFDELGSSEEYQQPDDLHCLAYEASYSIDEMCNALDSTVENFLSTEDLEQGTISEPYGIGWKSVRCDEGQFILSNDNALILTEHPIYRVVKVEVAKLNGDYWEELGDITPYVYEAAEYKTLSSYGGTYPYSRAYALNYTQGDNKISGFTFKQQKILDFCEAFEGTSIKNIIERIGKKCPNWYYELGFRVTYIPMTSARIKQYKPYMENGNISDNILLYNQSTNTVESTSYGENLKGTIARLGNMDELKTFCFRHYQDLPKVGQLWEDKYIARIEKEYQKEWIKATVTLTKDFNRLAQYLGLHTNYRLYDVSEKQSVERQINYSENVIIGNDTIKHENSDEVSISDDGVQIFAQVLNGYSYAQLVSNALVTTYDFTGKPLKKLHLSCTSTGLGNSLAFSWKFQDNYGAGYKSANSEAFKRIQEIVPYGDVYGEIDKIAFELYGGLPNYTLTKNMPFEFPEYNDAGAGEKAYPHFNFYSHPLIVRKDSREQLNITTQLHFVSNRKGIVLGSGLAQFNALVSANTLETELICSDKRLNIMKALFPKITNGSKDYSVNVNGKKIELILPQFSKDTKSWAIIGIRKDKAGNIKSKQLIIGENIIDGVVKPVYFNFISNKEKSV